MNDNRDEIDRIRRVYSQYRGGRAARWAAGNRGNVSIRRERDELIGRVLGDCELSPDCRPLLLEVGCGSGGILESFRDLGYSEGDLHGVDLLPDRVHEAHARLPLAGITIGDGSSLPFQDASFDIVVLSTVLSSILDGPLRQSVTREARRVTSNRGVILVYDFYVVNPRNRNTRPIRLREVEQLFEGLQVEMHKLTVVPPLARMFGGMSRGLYAFCRRMPLLLTHALYVVRNPRR